MCEFLFSSCDKISDKKQLKGRRVSSGLGFEEGWPVMAEKAWRHPHIRAVCVHTTHVHKEEECFIWGLQF